MKMTKQEFNDAVAHLRDGDQTEGMEPERYTEVVGRVMVAAAAIMNHRRGIPDEKRFRVTPSEIAEFLEWIDRRQTRLLKKIAEGVTEEGEGWVH